MFEIEEQIAEGRNETEVLTDEDYGNAIYKCVSDDFYRQCMALNILME
jgi:hypothetical protein